MAQQPRDYLKPALWLMGAILAMGSGIAAHNQWEQFEAEAIALIPDTADSYELQRSNLIHERRKDLLSGVGTVATIVGGVGLFLNLRLAERRLTLDMQKIQQDAKQTETRLTSERFSRATEQLGHESIHVRLGGIYSLEQIAKDSPEDHWTVIEVLSAFIREESIANLVDEEAEFSSVRADIQAALTVIGRRIKRSEPAAINLRQANLRDAELIAANLSGTDLRGANLVGANLTKINFTEASFDKANLAGAILRASNFTNASLGRVDLSEAILNNAKLCRAYLHESDLTRANLSDADLSDADLSWTNMTGTYLFEANFHKADLRHVNLRDAQVYGANLREANLTGADVSRVDLSETFLNKANFIEAQIEETIFPEGYKPNTKYE